MTTRAGGRDARLPVFAADGSCLEDVVAGGEQDEAGRRNLDSRFALLIHEGKRIRVDGWCCTIEAGVPA